MFLKLINVGDKCYLKKSCGGLTLVEVLLKTNYDITVKFIINSKVSKLSNEVFNSMYEGKTFTNRDVYDSMAQSNKYLKSAKVLREYYNTRPYLNINKHH